MVEQLRSALSKLLEVPEYAFRYLRPHKGLSSAFGDDAFGRFAEKTARFFGTPAYIVGQTIVVALWIVLNVIAGFHHWDPRPFILLNLIFSTQAATRKDALQVEVIGHQWWWEFRYPQYNVVTANELYLPLGRTVNFTLHTQDVLHSFFLPQLRIKQDAVPGLTIPVWFDSDTEGHYELLCAELCGWGHYKMRGNVTVHETQSEFDEWMSRSIAAQNVSQIASAGGPKGR